MAVQAPPPPDVTARATQAGLAVLVAAEVRAMVANVGPLQLRDSFPTVTAAVSTLLSRYGSVSATLAARQYVEHRRAAAVAGSYRPRVADPVPLPQISGMVGWATAPLADPVPDQAAGVTVERNLIAGTERLVANQARLTTIANVQADRKARAWAREARPGGCYFCALMASRGEVYKTEMTAGKTANARFKGDGEAKFHNNCHCTVVPVFGAFEMSALAREAAAVYRNRGPGNALNAFRVAWENRTPA